MDAHYSNSRYVTRIDDTQSSSTQPSTGILISLAVAVSSSVAEATLLAYIGSRVVDVQPSIATLCFVSSAVSLFPAIALSTLTWQHRARTSSARSVLAYTSVASLLVSLSLALGSSVWILVAPSSRRSSDDIVSPTVALIVISAITSLAGLVLLVAMFWTRSSSDNNQYIPSESLPEIAFINRPATSKTQTTVRSNPFSTGSGTNSPRFSVSAISIQSAPSRKNSKNQSRPSSRLSEVSQLDFEWDTSGVPATLRDTVHRKIPSKLPPIPGSRPVSPAKALDGPFLPPSPHPNQSQPASPIDDVFASQTVAEPFIEQVVLLPPQLPFTESSYQPSYTSSSTTLSAPKQISRCPSIISLVDSISHLAVNPNRENKEANIHPLFRASSGDSIPFASNKTIVTAATLIDAEEVASSNRAKPPPSRGGVSKPTSPLMRETRWEPVRQDTSDSSIAAPEEKSERPSSVSSDIIVLPSLPRSSIASRPRASTDCSDTRNESLLSTPPKAPSIADTVITKPSLEQKRQSTQNISRDPDSDDQDGLSEFHTGDLLIPDERFNDPAGRITIPKRSHA